MKTQVGQCSHTHNCADNAMPSPAASLSQGEYMLTKIAGEVFIATHACSHAPTCQSHLHCNHLLLDRREAADGTIIRICDNCGTSFISTTPSTGDQK